MAQVLTLLGETSTDNNQLFDVTSPSSPATELSIPGYTATSAPVTDFTAFDGVTYFSGSDVSGNGLQLWQVGAAGASEVSSTALSSDLEPSNLTVLGNKLFFSGLDSKGNGNLYVSNGTTSGTSQVVVNGASSTGVNPGEIVVFNNRVYFSGTDSNGSNGLWTSDGTTSGTTELAVGNTDVNNLSSLGAGLNPSNITVSNNKIFFAATDSNGNTGLWTSDGTAGGTVELAPANTFVSGLNPTTSDIVSFNGLTYFAGQDAAGKTGLWVSNGTSAGTSEINVPAANSSGLSPVSLTVFDGKLYFGGTDSSGSIGLWQSNGTASGTSELSVAGTSSAGLQPVAVNASSYPNVAMTIFDNTLFFTGVDSSGNYDLWKSDGTAAGTVQVSTPAAGGPIGLLPTDMSVVDFSGTPTPAPAPAPTPTPTPAPTPAPAPTPTSGPVTVGSGHDTIILDVSENAYQGNAQYTITVDGKQIGGTLTATALHSAGASQQVTVYDDLGDGTHSVAIDFLNSLGAGTPQTERSLFVGNSSYDGIPNLSTLALDTNGTQTLTVGVPSSAVNVVGSGSDTIALNISQDYYVADAQFTVSVDGKQVGGTLTASASHALGQENLFDVEGNFGAGTHTVAVDFLNDASDNSYLLDRNLYVDNASYDGGSASGSLSLYSTGTQSLTVGTALPSIPSTLTVGTGPDTISLHVSEDAYAGDAKFTVSVDGLQIGGTLTAQALHSTGASQILDVEGNFGSGTHAVGIDFINDDSGPAQAGSSSTDRNLYAYSPSYDGSAPSNGSLGLFDNGTQTLTVGTPIPTLLTVGSGSDTVGLQVSEDAYAGNAEFTVTVDGKQIGGTLTAEALHSSKTDQTFDIEGNFGSGTHSIGVDFLNDDNGPALSGSTSTDRNLYVDSASYDGTVAVGQTLGLFGAGTQYLTVGTAPPPIPSTLTVGGGADTISLLVSEDAYQGDAQYTVSVDNNQIGGTLTAQDSHSAGNDQTLNIEGNFGAGTHTVSVDFLNNLYAGTPQTDRNLYVDGASYDGVVSATGSLSLFNGGTQSLNVTSSVPSITVGSGSDTLALAVQEDAYMGDAKFTVSVDGQQVGGTLTAQDTRLSGNTQTFDIEGNFGSGPHTVSVDFLNDSYGGSLNADRNLYVNGATFDGNSVANSQLALLNSGVQSIAVNKPDTLTLQVSEDAYMGDAQFSVTVDGKQAGGVMTATASHSAGASQTVTLTGNFGLGQHTIGVDFLNNLYAGTPQTDRNLYVGAVSYDGNTSQANLSLFNGGTQTTRVASSTVYNPAGAGGSITTLGADTVNATSGIPASEHTDSALVVNAQGPSVLVKGGSGELTFLGTSGADTIDAGLGSTNVTGNADSLSFTAGNGAAIVNAGTGNEVYNLVSGAAGGSLVITNFQTGKDSIHLQGYSGSGIASQQTAASGTVFTLTDNTQIILSGTTNLTNHQIFA